MADNTPLDAMVAAAYERFQGEQGGGAPTPAPGPDTAGQTFQGFAASTGAKPVERAEELDAARGQTSEAFAAVPARQLVPIFNPLTAPCVGMYSAVAPSSLKPGQFSLLENLRYDDASLMVRQPTTQRSTTGLPGGASSARGCGAGSLVASSM